MKMTPLEIAALLPEAFLSPEKFVISSDASKTEFHQEQYDKGLKISNQSNAIDISINGVWSASVLDGSHIFSYEVIGYHACTADLLRGFLAGNAAIIVHRDFLPKPVTIKERLIDCPGVTFHYAQNVVYGPKLSLRESFRFASLMSKFRVTVDEYKEAKTLYEKSSCGAKEFSDYFKKNG